LHRIEAQFTALRYVAWSNCHVTDQAYASHQATFATVERAKVCLTRYLPGEDSP
jgi:hypothetical protein